MGLPVEKLGRSYESRRAVVDPERAKAYAAATNDDNPAYESGKYAPPVFGVVPTWDALTLVVADFITPEMFMMLVHGEQDMHFHQPLVPGRSVVSTGHAHSIRVAGSGTRLTTRVEATDAEDGFAKSVGLPGIILHGLCTMAMTSQAVIRTVADGDPARLKRLAVRFSGNVLPGNDVTTTLYDAGSADGRRAYAFEAESGGTRGIANGRGQI